MFPYVLHPLNSIALTASIYMTMAIAIERYIAVYHPLDYNRVMMDATTHSRRLAGYLIPVCLVAILFNIPKFLESRIVFIGENIHLDITELRTSELYVTYYHNWARLMVLGVVPVLVISFLNFKIYTAVRSRRGGRKRYDEHLSTVLMMIVLIFIICNLPRMNREVSKDWITSVVGKNSEGYK
ncbi:FMRFamide receptor [Eurytemora carolleeae]|uniref:FMRFamide receptor n=1 Tax=Eurytemora carolleeae TaxID=1294199 RepID=UPI000C78ACEF|nr:FMRFamide receptor [Eurytemora carolleeae]|eukprot:XP_023344057.1 FMRFamide receptor-like [Eurytemora affinis]